MSSEAHAVVCPTCSGVQFREEKIVEINEKVVINEKLPLPAQTISAHYRYICVTCNNVLTYE